MLWIISGLICILAGIVIMVLGSMWGLLLMLVGVVCMALNYVFMMRGRGFDPDQGSINGPGGKGKQQTDAVKAPQPGSGEQPANIWEMMEK